MPLRLKKIKTARDKGDLVKKMWSRSKKKKNRFIFPYSSSMPKQSPNLFLPLAKKSLPNPRSSRCGATSSPPSERPKLSLELGEGHRGHWSSSRRHRSSSLSSDFLSSEVKLKKTLYANLYGEIRRGEEEEKSAGWPEKTSTRVDLAWAWVG